MGDAIDSEDIDCFLNSPEGQRHLDALRSSLSGQRIAGVCFTNELQRVGVVLTMEDGECHEIALPGLDVDTLREEFHEALERQGKKEEESGELASSPSHGFCCPECGHNDVFAIEVARYLTLYADGTITESDEGHQWDGASPCRCEDCDHEGIVSDFVAGDKP